MVVKHLGLGFKSCFCCCVTLGKFLNLSETHFFHLKNERNYSTYAVS